MDTGLLNGIVEHLLLLADASGGFAASPQHGYLGKADGVVSDLAATVYAAEIAQTLGVDLPHRAATLRFIQARQMPDGYFRNSEPRPGVRSADYFAYQTCMGVRGLKALGAAPKYDPRPWCERTIRDAATFGPYQPDFFANIYAALEAPMPPDCVEKLRAFLLARQRPDTGWIVQSGEFPPQRNNPMTFHAARVFRLTGGTIPMAERILETFLGYQQEDGSWSKGGVHGTFDACVGIRLLGGATSAAEQAAIQRGADWALTCQRPGHGFNHFGDAQPAETDAFYFHVATLVMAGRLPNALPPGNTWIGWGHSLVGRTLETKA